MTVNNKAREKSYFNFRQAEELTSMLEKCTVTISTPLLEKQSHRGYLVQLQS